MAKGKQILFILLLSSLLFGCKEKYPDLFLTADQEEPDYMAEVRASRIYKFVGKGPLVLSHKAESGEDDFMESTDRSFLFFVLENGVAEKHYRTWCNNCWEYGDVEDAKNKCEKWYLGKKCYLYKVGSRTMNDEFNKFKDKVVWDFWNTASDGTSPSFTTQKTAPSPVKHSPPVKPNDKSFYEIDRAQEKCKEIALTPKTPDFAKCVMRLMD